MSIDALVHRWASVDVAFPSFRGVVDETIRDGLQTPNCPPADLEFKRAAIHAMQRVGIDDVIAGMWRADTKPTLAALLEDLAKGRPAAWVLCRSHTNDVRELIDFKLSSGLDFGLNLFVSLSGIRMFAEGWERAGCERRLFDCLELGRARFRRIRVALEDSTRTPPEVLVPIVRRLTELEVSRITLADTAGVAMPGLARSLVGTLLSECPGLSNPNIGLEWHGHNDRGMAVACSLEALDAGVHHVHGTICGIGERNGNMSLDTFMLNLTECPRVEARYQWDELAQYRDLVCDRFEPVLREAYPFFGQSSFASATGTHVAAIHKAMEMGRNDVARQLFSPPSWSNNKRDPSFGVSYLTGQRGVAAALAQLGLSAGDDNVRRVRQLAQAVQRPLTEAELRDACGLSR